MVDVLRHRYIIDILGGDGVIRGLGRPGVAKLFWKLSEILDNGGEGAGRQCVTRMLPHIGLQKLQYGNAPIPGLHRHLKIIREQYDQKCENHMKMGASVWVLSPSIAVSI